MKKKYDLIVIGGGPAGTPVAMEYAGMNPDKTIALVDIKGKLGGECLFDGCIPSKIMKISAESISELHRVKEFGIEIKEIDYSKVWETIKRRKEEILNKRTKGAYNKLLTFGNIELLKGKASFNSKNSILIGEEEIEFERCVIATGSKPFIPPFKGNGVEKLWTNQIFFEKMELPKSLTIIGDGPIAIEFAQILSVLGTKIILIGMANSILNMMDSEFSNIILEKLKANKNIEIILEATAKEINYNNNEFEVIYSKDDKDGRVKSERVLVATGRIANTEGLNLEKAEITLEKTGIHTDKHLLTTNEKVYSNGDVVANFPKFAHTATYGSHIIAKNLHLEHNFSKVNFDTNTWVLFSNPNIAIAGITEKEANERKIEILTETYDYKIDAKLQVDGNEIGYLKYIVDKKNLKIIGIAIALKDANSVAGEATAIISKGVTLKELTDMIHPHPTYSEAFTVLAKQMMGKIMIEKMSNPLAKTLLKIERAL
jgi:dihydrolipoamide dehydrogenase